MENFALALIKVSTFFVFLPALFAIRRITNGTREQRVLSVLVFVCLIIEMTALIMASVFHTSNLILLHFFTPLEFLLITLIFQKTLSNFWPQKFTYWIIILFIVGSIVNSTFFEPITRFNAYARVAEALLLILFALMYFYHTLVNVTVPMLERTPLFWFSTGVFIYYSGTMFINIYSNILFGESSNSFYIWGLHGLLSILLYLSYTIALWVSPET